jgi:hypothetical protein
MELTIVQAARAIRPYLGNLLADDAEDFDRRVSVHLNSIEDDGREARLSQLLASRPETQQWTARFLELGGPPQVYADQERVIPGTLGIGPDAPIPVQVFECPHGDCTWYQPRVGAEPPTCPDHGKLLPVVRNS